MPVDPEIRRRLLELVYDLVADDEAAELRARIDADPEMAKAYAEAGESSELLARAARLESPKIPLAHPAQPPRVAADAPRAKVRTRADVDLSTPWARTAHWVVGTTAGILLAVLVVGWLYDRAQLADIAAGHLRLRVTGPARLQAGAENEYRITTTTVTGEPTETKIHFALFTPDGTRLMAHTEQTGALGRLTVAIPADLNLPDETRLEVVAGEQAPQERIDTRLSVNPIRYATHLSLDKPLYQPGETVYYRSLTLSRFGLAADREQRIRFEILDPGGAVLPGSTLAGVTRQSVGCGAFVLPEGIAGGEYTLAAKSLDDAFSEERATFFIRRYRLPRLKKELEFGRDSYTAGDTVTADFAVRRAEGGPVANAPLRLLGTIDGEKVLDDSAQKTAPDGTFRIEFTLPDEIPRGDGQLLVAVDDQSVRETIAKTIPLNLGKVEVSFYPEGGDLVAGMINRVYFSAANPLGEPVDVTGRVLDTLGRAVASVQTTHHGMGTFRLEPRPGEQYRLKIESPRAVEGLLPLPEVSSTQQIVLDAGVGVFEAGQPLEFNVRAVEAKLPLVVAAWCRGVPVGQQTLVTQAKANPVSIPLNDDVGGVIRLTVYDYQTNPPQPIAERLVYRRRPQGLKIVAGGQDDRYSPGERVSVSLRVTDESGKPAAAVLGAAVVDDALLSLADDDSPAMPTHLLLTTEIENPEDLEEADFYLSQGQPADVALDLLLGTQGWRRFVQKTLRRIEAEGRNHEQLARLIALGQEADPPAMFDNLLELQNSYQESISQYRANRTRTFSTLTTIAFFGGLGLVLLVAMLSLLNIASGLRLWGPAIAVAGACLVVGMILINPQRPGLGRWGDVAFAPFDMAPATPPESESTAADQPTEQKAEQDEQALRLEMMDAKEFAAEEAADAIPPPDAEPLAAPAEAGGAPGLPEDQMYLEKAQAAFGPGQNLQDFDVADERFRARRQLGQGLNTEAEGLLRRGLAMAGARAKDLDPSRRFTVRQYAHQHRAGPPGVRSDFAQTLFWHPMLIADNQGRAEIEFDLPDSLTTFRIRVDGHAPGGRIGTGGGQVVSRIPFSLEPKLPLEVTAGDRIDLPLAVVNDTADKLPVTVALEHGELVRLDDEAPQTLELGPRGRDRVYFPLQVVGRKGNCRLTFRGTAVSLTDTGPLADTGLLADAVQRGFSVVPPGFPKNISYGGRIEGRRELLVRLPDDWIPGSLQVSLHVFPSMLADLEQGLDGMLREPHGCFEQASTANYPNVLTLSYLQENNLANPAVTRRAKDLLGRGYRKLIGYECPQQGYEWFGDDPPHEALTAYGLMEFRDMAAVYDVDQEMVGRTAEWLLGRRDASGGFQRNPKALDRFGGAPKEITDTYITWALSESGQEGIEDQIDHVAQLAEASDDPYLLALAGAATINAGKEDIGKKILDKLALAQAEDGHLEGTSGSITRSGGRSLQVETTALAALAWLKLPAFGAPANRALQWIVQNRQGTGGFGSTQATILALKALLEQSKANRRQVNAGKLILKRDDAVLIEQAFAAGSREAIVLDGLETHFTSGDNRLTIELTGDNRMSYVLHVGYRNQRPADNNACPLGLSTRLAKDTVRSGDSVELVAELVNTSEQGQPMTVAILGLPAGLELRPDQLEDLKKAGRLDYYETRARELICYWRSLAPEQRIELKLDLIAALPGRYTGPASRAYLYYTAEQKRWNDPLRVEIRRE